jgi:hypothetical protein
MALIASRGADSTDLIQLVVPADGFLRRDLYLGPARTVVARDARPTDSLALVPRRLRAGDGSVSGTVVAAAGGLPLAGAQVRIADGPQARADERGEWTIVDAPLGTRMLEVRAIGQYPARQPVDVVEGAAPVKVVLSTLRAMLDTVRILAARPVYNRDRDGFDLRRRSGLGRYLTPQDIVRRNPTVTSDLFRMLPGVRLQRDSSGFSRQVLVNGVLAGWCVPTVYIDGHAMNGLTADDIDDWVNPDHIAGIEVYSGTFVPGEFQQAMSGCGSIVIWTK